MNELFTGLMNFVVKALLAWLLWNLILPSFGLPKINFPQALGIVFLAHAVTGVPLLRAKR